MTTISSRITDPAVKRPATYFGVLRTQSVFRLLAGTLVGRLPNAMAPLGILLITATGSGTGALGGLLSALYVLASALSQPVKGRLMARYGQTRVSGPAAAINAGGLVALAAVGGPEHPFLSATVILFAGTCTPPLEAGLRALWGTVLPHPGERRAALALDTGSQGILQIVGPMLVAVLASTHRPSTALVVTAALGLTGAATVLTTSASRTWTPIAPRHTATSPLRHNGIRLLLLALAGTGFAAGAMTVWAVNMAARHHADLLAGAIPAAFATSSFASGLIFGRRTWPGTLHSQLLAAAAGYALCWLPLLTLPSPTVAAAFAVLPGLFLPVVIASAYMMVDSLTAGDTTETYAWLILTLGVGSATGTALAGTFATHPLASAALLAIGGAVALAALACARSDLSPRPAAHGPGAADRPASAPARLHDSL
ncbi:MFS transporter [Kitasatospora cystarginea]|uniref:MFS transporter n=1 Tax=Kitasatospora cystarginea TaxID=58350 RepID=UPI0031D102E0